MLTSSSDIKSPLGTRRLAGWTGPWVTSRLQAPALARYHRVTTSQERLGSGPCPRHIQAGKLGAGL